MTSPGPVNLPPEQCPSSLRGRCARCQGLCHRYGQGGNPLCQPCRAEVVALQKPRAKAA